MVDKFNKSPITYKQNSLFILGYFRYVVFDRDITKPSEYLPSRNNAMHCRDENFVKIIFDQRCMILADFVFSVRYCNMTKFQKANPIFLLSLIFCLCYHSEIIERCFHAINFSPRC